MTNYTKLPLLITAVVSLLVLSGCVSTTEQKNSGFLKNYENFVDSKIYDNTKIYRADGFGKKSIAELKEIKLVPFEIWITPDLEANFNPQQLVALSQYFHQKLKANLTNSHYKIVDEANANTLIIQGAFSDIKFEDPELSATDFIPFRILINAGNAAYLQVTEAKDVITKVSVELEFLQGVEQKRVFAVISTKSVDSTIAKNGKDNMKAVKELLDIWADNFVKNLVAVKRGQ